MRDLVDRQAAIEAMGVEPLAFSEYENGLHDKWEDDVEVLMKLPSAQSEPKTVIYSGDGYADGHMVYDLAECPECGYEYEEGDMSWGETYCPHCGQLLNWNTEGDWK